MAVPPPRNHTRAAERGRTGGWRAPSSLTHTAGPGTVPRPGAIPLGTPSAAFRARPGPPAASPEGEGGQGPRAGRPRPRDREGEAGEGAGPPHPATAAPQRRPPPARKRPSPPASASGASVTPQPPPLLSAAAARSCGPGERPTLLRQEPEGLRSGAGAGGGKACRRGSPGLCEGSGGGCGSSGSARRPWVELGASNICLFFSYFSWCCRAGWLRLSGRRCPKTNSGKGSIRPLRTEACWTRLRCASSSAGAGCGSLHCLTLKAAKVTPNNRVPHSPQMYWFCRSLIHVQLVFVLFCFVPHPSDTRFFLDRSAFCCGLVSEPFPGRLKACIRSFENFHAREESRAGKRGINENTGLERIS